MMRAPARKAPPDLDRDRRVASGTSTLLALTATALLAIGAGACGSAGSRAGTATRSGSSFAAAAGAVPGTRANLGQLRGDEDNDAQGAGGYYDRDDADIAHYGRAASAGETQAIAALVRRYFAAAAAGDAARGCALASAILAESLPENYGGPPAPRYLLGAHTCRAVLARVFEDLHAQLVPLAARLEVTGVRVRGNRADALLGWGALPAGLMEARREGGAWKIEEPLASPLP
jgi:hypothetical protein